MKTISFHPDEGHFLHHCYFAPSRKKRAGNCAIGQGFPSKFRRLKSPRGFNLYNKVEDGEITIMIIYKQFTFDSAHFLPNVREGHKCKQLHGHTYHLTVYAQGELKQPEGWLVDYGDLKAIVKPIIDTLDHALLNNIPGLENPTAEMLATWLWSHIKPLLPQLSRIELKETPTSGVIYEG